MLLAQLLPKQILHNPLGCIREPFACTDPVQGKGSQHRQAFLGARACHRSLEIRAEAWSEAIQALFQRELGVKTEPVQLSDQTLKTRALITAAQLRPAVLASQRLTPMLHLIGCDPRGYRGGAGVALQPFQLPTQALHLTAKCLVLSQQPIEIAGDLSGPPRRRIPLTRIESHPLGQGSTQRERGLALCP